MRGRRYPVSAALVVAALLSLGAAVLLHAAATARAPNAPRGARARPSPPPPSPPPPPPVPTLTHTCATPPWLAPGFARLHALQQLLHRGPGACRAPTARLVLVGESMDRGTRIGAAASEVSSLEGFGSVVRSIAHALGVAEGTNRTLALRVGNWSYGGSEACTEPPDEAPWTCVFAPLSPCTASDAVAGEAADAAALPAGLAPADEAAWRRAHARYMHKDWARVRPGTASPSSLFPLRAPPAVSAAGGEVDDWLAVLRAYALAHALPATVNALRWYGGLPRADAAGSATIGLHVRVGDRGGGGAALAATWARFEAAALRIREATGAARLLVATDCEDLDDLAPLLATTAALGFTVRLVPSRFRTGGGPGARYAEFLRDHPEARADATLDALAAVDLLGRCDFLVGRRYSTLFHLAVSLQRARGCRRPGARVAAVWLVDEAGDAAPGDPPLTEQGFEEDAGPPS